MASARKRAIHRWATVCASKSGGGHSAGAAYWRCQASTRRGRAIAAGHGTLGGTLRCLFFAGAFRETKYGDNGGAARLGLVQAMVIVVL